MTESTIDRVAATSPSSTASASAACEGLRGLRGEIAVDVPRDHGRIGSASAIAVAHPMPSVVDLPARQIITARHIRDTHTRH